MELIITEKKEPNPTICLNMIVKNESKIIQRMLQSVLPIIDTYCICDTGSTDNTKELIKEFFDENNITGKIVEESFINFEHNRNVALNACVGMSDYALLMDADMTLQINQFKKSDLLSGDAFHILQGTEGFYYENVRIVKNDGSYKYFGVTHEFVGRNKPEILKKLPKTSIFIVDYGDGGCKSDKYERDIRLLKEGLEKEPQNVRYHFYLANSYFCIGNHEEAIKWYRARIHLGGWIEEIWYSYYKIGLCYKSMGKMPDAIYSWLEGYNHYPHRVENLHEIINHYRHASKRKSCLVFYELAKKIISNNEKCGINKDGFLFLHNDIYTHLLDYEYTVFAFYLDIKNINKQAMAVFNYSNDNSIINNVFQNLKFYRDILKSEKIIDMSFSIEKEILGEKATLNSSSSCLLPNVNNDGYIMNYRLVDYKILDNGSYICHKNNIDTFNKYVELDKEFNIIPGTEKLFDVNDFSRSYSGIEDIRIFNYKDKIKTANNVMKFIGTTLHKDNSLGIVMGDYNINDTTLHHNDVKCSFASSNCEKNWSFFNYKGETHIVYKWFPLQICKINLENNLLELVEKRESLPLFFKHLRGSSSGFSYGDEIWFVTHCVSYEQPRKYYHCICIFDENMQLKKYSAPFNFQGENIEFCLSITVEEDRVIIPYSTWDRTTKIAVYNKQYLLDNVVVF